MLRGESHLIQREEQLDWSKGKYIGIMNREAGKQGKKKETVFEVLEN